MGVIWLVLGLVLSSPQSTCVPPGGDFSRAVTESVTVVSYANCYLTVRRADSTIRAIFMGFPEKDWSPSIGATTQIRYDPVTMQGFVAIFSTYPWKEASVPTPSPTPTCIVTQPLTNTTISLDGAGSCMGVCATVGYQVQATSTSGIKKVELWMPPQGGDTNWYQVGVGITTPPYVWTYTLTPKTYQHVARCYDSNNILGQSAPITITVAGIVPTPTPTPTPMPSPSPTPTPSPTPSSCSITVPPTVNMAQWSSTVVIISGNDVNGMITASAATGQVSVTPTSRQVSGSSFTAQYRLDSKKKNSSVRFDSPCGSRTMQVIVN